MAGGAAGGVGGAPSGLTFAAGPSYLRAALADKRRVGEDDTAKPALVRLEGVVLGGSGLKIRPGREVTVAFYNDSIVISGSDMTDRRITYPEIVDIQIEGPGAVSRGGGFIGGGFGFEGALEGMAVAGVLNALTSKTKIHTFIQILSDAGELFLHYGALEPRALRIALSPVYLRLRQLDQAHIAARTERLAALRRRDVINDEELARLTAQLTDVEEAAELAPPSTEEWLQCQSCRRLVRLVGEDRNICPVCKQVARLG